MDRLGKESAISFWDRAQTEEGGSSSIDRPRMDGGLQPTQRESPIKQQAVRIVSTHQEEFLLQSTATWEQLWEQKKGERR